VMSPLERATLDYLLPFYSTFQQRWYNYNMIFLYTLKRSCVVTAWNIVWTHTIKKICMSHMHH
jgi:hypothetical protein